MSNEQVLFLVLLGIVCYLFYISGHKDGVKEGEIKARQQFIKWYNQQNK